MRQGDSVRRTQQSAGAACCLGLLLFSVARPCDGGPVVSAPHPRGGPEPTQPVRATSRGQGPAASQPGDRLSPEGQAALQAEKQFAQDIMERFNVRMALVETPHFAIWTTLPSEQHRVLSTQCEAMYAALLKIFQMPATQPVFLGKCGVFVMANQTQFADFCQHVQQIPSESAKQAIGFQLALPDGRSRIIAFWPGNTQELAEVLVHEGSHAFLQCYRNDGHVVAWFNEGLAEHVTGLVFRRQCSQGRDALQQAANLVRGDPQVLAKLLATDSSLPGEYYPLAQSVVAFLVQANGSTFVQLIQGLKNTEPFPQALQKTYKATIPELDTHWRKWLLDAAASGKSPY